ncbi:hypothetical protein HanXRQr2_Chr07g0287781 [Helianthus annuus]|uniref:Uncharacterized protein n=1 Tax=Helianthus annuus TaxID=4232 RepID=A0A9K3NFM9_HELAN|nr:hypothetical protein HanXRQr2_Chr07g0287781 [Helianthus annuus]KAJ0904147.1 hypothetical protein HanPSC8_Chr07g0278581 [Helianthus annuus]
MLESDVLIITDKSMQELWKPVTHTVATRNHSLRVGTPLETTNSTSRDNGCESRCDS